MILVQPIFFIFWRLIKQKLQKRKRGKKDIVLKPRWEDDYELVENEGLFAEYLEMGITLFLLTRLQLIAGFWAAHVAILEPDVVYLEFEVLYCFHCLPLGYSARTYTFLITFMLCTRATFRKLHLIGTILREILFSCNRRIFSIILDLNSLFLCIAFVQCVVHSGIFSDTINYQLLFFAMLHCHFIKFSWLPV